MNKEVADFIASLSEEEQGILDKVFSNWKLWLPKIENVKVDTLVDIVNPKEPELAAEKEKVLQEQKQNFEFPSLSFIEARVVEFAALKTDFPSLPAKLENDETFRGNYYNEGNTARMNGLRPYREETLETILQEISELPWSTGEPGGLWKNSIYGVPCPIPQVIGGTPPSGSYFLRPYRADNILQGNVIIGEQVFEEWEYRGRKIKMLKDGWEWRIEGGHPSFVWTFGTVPTNPCIEWMLIGEVHINTKDGPEIYMRHPSKRGSMPPTPGAPWKQKEPIGILDIYSEEVYGQAWLGLRKLGFFGGLNVAINWIEGAEWALGAGSRPPWID